VVDLVLYRASIAPSQEPRAIRVADVRWVAAQELENYAFPPADQATTDLLLGINRDTCLFRPANVKAVRAKAPQPEIH
jgi:hypothetical protein